MAENDFPAYHRSLINWETLARPYFKARKNEKRNDTPAPHTREHPPTYTVLRKVRDPNDKDPIPNIKEMVEKVEKQDRSQPNPYGYIPQRTDEYSFKKLYAQEARLAGIPANVILGIYAYETAGNGKATEQPGGLSTALGPAQLLNPNTVKMFAEYGLEFAQKLVERGEPGLANIVRAMHRDAAQVKKDFAAYENDAKKLPRYMQEDILRSSVTAENAQDGFEEWDFYKSFSKTPEARIMHLANLEKRGGLGAMIPTRKLLDEMNARWDPKRNTLVNITSREPVGTNRVKWEMHNLLGREQAERALQPGNSDASTGNFISMQGYESNPAVRNKSVKQLMNSMDSVMNTHLKNKGAVELAGIFNLPEIKGIQPQASSSPQPAPPPVAPKPAPGSEPSATQKRIDEGFSHFRF